MPTCRPPTFASGEAPCNERRRGASAVMSLMSCERSSSATMRRGRAFTIVELLVVVVIGLILLAIFIPYRSALREQDRRMRCAENLRQLRNALQHYADDNNHEYPRVTYDMAARPAGYSSFTGIDADNAFAA